MELINYPYRLAGYYIQSKIYEFKSKEPREDAFLDSLRSNGISMVDINLALDNINPSIPRIIRLPGVLLGRDHLIDIINSGLCRFSQNSKNKNLPRDKKAMLLARYISRVVHTDLAFDPQVFSYIMTP